MKENRDEGLTAIYQGKLTREVISMIVKAAMASKRLSLRAAEEKTGLAKSQIQKIRSGEASIESGLSFLKALGFEVEATLSLSLTENDGPKGPNSLE